MSDQGFFVALIGSAAVVVLLISDWQRLRAELRARPNGSPKQSRRMNLGMALLLIAAFIGYGIVHGHPEWTNGDFGLLNGLVHHFFPVRLAE